MTRRRFVVPLAAAALLGAGVPAAYAYWADPATTTTGSFAAGTVSAPTLSCGALGVLSVTFNWTAVTGATGYTLHYGAGGASTLNTTNTTATLVAAITGGTAWVVAHRDFASTTWSSASSNTRSYTVAVVSLCS